MDKVIITRDMVFADLPKREVAAHKGNFGRILLLCGSVGYTGAASLAAMGALRSGSGLAFLGVPESIYPIVAGKLTEPIVFPLPAEQGALSVKAQREILVRLPKMDAVLLGPGLGRTEGTLACVRTVLEEAKIPVILDADGINVMAAHKDVLRESACPLILTPHEGEFVRLLGRNIISREEDAMHLARELDCICVLKGHNTVVTDGETCYISPVGNPGMATGGCGDVLAGIITSLCGQGLSPLPAAKCGVWLHGRAGDICAEEIGQYGMLPTDMLQALTRLLP